ncbi:MAG TPA: hypothetical protein ENH28_02910 [Euryarchaeota archaeon]|nr:hypothetical protein [Euryarchaeota archaeon]
MRVWRRSTSELQVKKMRINSVFTIAKKDLKAEFRTKHTLNFMFLFSFLSIIIFSRVMQDYKYTNAGLAVAPGLLWLVFIYTGLLGIGRAFIKEKELGTLDGLRLTPLTSTDILVGKALYNFVIILIIQTLIFPLFIVFFDYPMKGSFALAYGVLTLGNLSFVVVGSSLSSLVLNAKAKELLLPILILPVVFPLVIISISALSKVMLYGAGIINIFGEIKILVGYVVIMSIIALLTFEFALED